MHEAVREDTIQNLMKFLLKHANTIYIYYCTFCGQAEPLMVIIMASDQVRHSVDCGAGTAPFLAVNSATIVVSLFSFFLPSLTRNYLQLHNLTQTIR